VIGGKEEEYILGGRMIVTQGHVSKGIDEQAKNAVMEENSRYNFAPFTYRHLFSPQLLCSGRPERPVENKPKWQ
jgi:hypothetical protein